MVLWHAQKTKFSKLDFTLKQERRLYLHIKCINKIFGLKEGLRKLHNRVLHYVYSSPPPAKVINLKRM
jgi:hypothetical protein